MPRCRNRYNAWPQRSEAAKAGNAAPGFPEPKSGFLSKVGVKLPLRRRNKASREKGPGVRTDVGMTCLVGHGGAFKGRRGAATPAQLKFLTQIHIRYTSRYDNGARNGGEMLFTGPWRAGVPDGRGTMLLTLSVKRSARSW